MRQLIMGFVCGAVVCAVAGYLWLTWYLSKGWWK